MLLSTHASARSHRLLYGIYGTMFGLLFPVCSTIFDALYRFDSLALDALLMAHRSSPLHWVIDTAPVFLGLFASLAGKRQDVIEAALADLQASHTQVTEAHKQLEAANQSLQAALDAKGQFLAKMSHELRTPLNVVIGFSRILLERSADKLEKRSQRHLQMVFDSGQHLLSLVNDMLDLERMAVGKLKVSKQPVDLCEAVYRVHETLKPGAEAAGYQFVVEAPSTPIKINTDPDRLRQVITNLTNNAIKYAGKGKITIAVEPLGQGDGVRLSVKDTGQGIPQEQLEAIFQPFHQVDNSRARDRDGAGLGLNIVQRLVELLGGTVSVQSRVGEGSTFAVEFPASTLVGDDAAVTSQPAADVTNPGLIRYDSDTGEHELPATAPRVLVIDDKRELLELLRHDLRAAGFRVDIAASGEAGLRAAREKRPDAIVLDIIMPGLDGWEVLRRLRADPDIGGTPVVVSSMLDNEPRAAEFAVAAWLTKPFAADELRRVLHSVSDPMRGDVLIVEDDEATRELLRTTLASLGAPLRFAGAGEVALAEIERAEPGAVVLDLGLPDISGFELLRRIRAGGRTSLPVVVYTGRTLSEEEASQLKAGFAEVIEKHAARGPAGVVGLLKAALARKT